jgi:hypothetical protein
MNPCRAGGDYQVSINPRVRYTSERYIQVGPNGLVEVGRCIIIMVWHGMDRGFTIRVGVGGRDADQRRLSGEGGFNFSYSLFFLVTASRSNNTSSSINGRESGVLCVIKCTALY